MGKPMRIAAFGGFRSLPPEKGAAGSDKFAFELYPRIADKGYTFTAYSRIYPGDTKPGENQYRGIRQLFFKTVNRAGFDTLIHSFKCTLHVIFKNTANVVHLHSGANSIWAIPLRLAGKRVIVSQFAMDWKRDKWPWYGKLFYILSSFMTAYFPNRVIFDNVFTKAYFEKKFHRKFDFIPYGSEVNEPPDNCDVLNQLGVESNKYFLFVGRFIPDKGVHLLTEAFKNVKTDLKLVLIGGSPNPGPYESEIKKTTDNRIIFPGYIYGDDTNILIKHAYCYVQPSLIEGLSPVILTVMGLGTPLICSNIQENTFITKENATHFETNNVLSLQQKIEEALASEARIKSMAQLGKNDIKERFNWDRITDEFIEKFKS